jgi:hypothetical protein
MSDILGGFIEKKKAESIFLSLQDGESVVIKNLKDIKPAMKAGYDGKDKEVLNFTVEVETSEGLREKLFQNGTQRFAKELQDKGVQPGCGFTLARTGQQAKTRYTVSNVTGKAAPVAAPAAPEVPKE